MMAELGKNQRQMLKDLEEVRSKYETVVEDESIKALPRAVEKINEDFDAILQKIEDCEYQDDKEEEDEETTG